MKTMSPMELIGLFLVMEINYICTNKLWQTLEQMIAGELTYRWKIK